MIVALASCLLPVATTSADDKPSPYYRAWMLHVVPGQEQLAHVLDGLGADEFESAIVRSLWAELEANLSTINKHVQERTHEDVRLLNELHLELDPWSSAHAFENGKRPAPRKDDDGAIEDDPRWLDVSLVHGRIKDEQRRARIVAVRQLDITIEEIAAELHLEDAGYLSMRALVRREVFGGGITRRQVPASANATVQDIVLLLQKAAGYRGELKGILPPTCVMDRCGPASEREEAFRSILFAWEIGFDEWLSRYYAHRLKAAQIDAPRGLTMDDSRFIKINRVTRRLGAAQRRLFRQTAESVALWLEEDGERVPAAEWRRRCEDKLTPIFVTRPWPMRSRAWLLSREDHTAEQKEVLEISLRTFEVEWERLRGEARRSLVLAWDASPEMAEEAMQRSGNDRLAMHRLSRDWIANFAAVLSDLQRQDLFSEVHDAVGFTRRSLTGPAISVGRLKKLEAYKELSQPMFKLPSSD